MSDFMKKSVKAMAVSLFCAAPLILHAGTVSALDPACQPGTLQSYLNLASQSVPGCSIGILNFDGFTFLSSSGSPDAAADILVTPATNGFGFTQVSGTPFTGPAHYQIGYNFVIDPAPVLDGADLALDPPFGPVVITQYFCLDSTMTSGINPSGSANVVCNGRIATPQSLTVTPQNPFASIVFDPIARIGGSILTDIQIGAGGQFDGVTGDAHVTGSPATPEPVSAALLLSGLAWIGLKKRSKIRGSITRP